MEFLALFLHWEGEGVGEVGDEDENKREYNRQGGGVRGPFYVGSVFANKKRTCNYLAL